MTQHGYLKEMPEAHFKSLRIENYRSFLDLSVNNLTRLNVIGGINGSGKSSFLEAAFNLADRLNPAALFRPYQFRGIPLAPTDNLDAITQVFHNRNTAKPIKISANTNDGMVSIAYEYGPQKLEFATVQVVQDNITQQKSETSYATTDGYKITSKRKQITDFEAKVQLSSAGVQVQITNQTADQIPQSVILNIGTRSSEASSATRYSNLVRKGNVERLNEFLHLVHPEIIELSLLQVGGQSLLHANLGKSNWVAMPFLGEGAVSLTSAILAISDCEGGVVFLDEVDSTVHHTKLQSMWKLIISAGKMFNVQIFATTHSNESLEALTAAITSEKAQDISSYHRIRKNMKGGIEAISYSGNEIVESIMQDWEVR